MLKSGEIPHHTRMVPECEGTESSLTECLKQLGDGMTCHFVLVECRNNTSETISETSKIVTLHGLCG